MKITSLMSGWSITEYGELNFVTHGFVCLSQVDRMKDKTANWLLKNYNFHTVFDMDEKFVNTFKLPSYLLGRASVHGAWLECDDDEKIAIMENHPDLEKQLIETFGENWANYYLRFGH